jgi:hypothetical protein
MNENEIQNKEEHVYDIYIGEYTCVFPKININLFN